MGSIWTYKYGNNTIIVKNVKETELYVNDQLQDRKGGLSLRAELKGKLESGEDIRVSLGGTFNVDCTLFVNNVLQTPVEIV